MAGKKNDDRLKAAVGRIDRLGPTAGSLWRHKNGKVYKVVANAVRECDLTPVVVYVSTHVEVVAFGDKLAVCWTRPLSEFMDGRFTEVAATRP